MDEKVISDEDLGPMYLQRHRWMKQWTQPYTRWETMMEARWDWLNVPRHAVDDVGCTSRPDFRELKESPKTKGTMQPDALLRGNGNIHTPDGR